MASPGDCRADQHWCSYERGCFPDSEFEKRDGRIVHLSEPIHWDNGKIPMIVARRRPDREAVASKDRCASDERWCDYEAACFSESQFEERDGRAVHLAQPLHWDDGTIPMLAPPDDESAP